MRWPSWLRRGDPEEAEHLKLGRRGEKLAVRHLKRNGYRVLARNWRCKHDELDVVARRDDLLVVVEVKTRRDTTFGRPADAVDREKRRRLSRAGLAYVKRLRAKPRALRRPSSRQATVSASADSGCAS